MKKSIVYLGIIAVAFSNVILASNVVNEQLFSTMEKGQTTSFTEQNEQLLSSSSADIAGNANKLHSIEDTSVFDPKSVITTMYVKTTEEIIADNKQITESSVEEIQPLSIESTIADVIIEDNQIIESTITNVIYPLDFDKINRSVNYFKALHNNNNKAMVVDDLKL